MLTERREAEGLAEGRRTPHFCSPVSGGRERRGPLQDEGDEAVTSGITEMLFCRGPRGPRRGGQN